MAVIHQSLTLGFLLCSSWYNLVSGLKCLSCSNVIQPRHCHYVRECPPGDRCGVIKYVTVSNDVRYDVECFTAEDCIHTTKASRELTDSHQQIQGIDHTLCRQCCNSSLCHHNGCGENGFPDDIGLLCFTCKQSTDPSKCEHYSVCQKEEICHLDVTEEFGDNIFTSSCQHRSVCQDPSANIFGRKRDQPTSCNRCCSSDLCNDKCQDSTPTNTTTQSTLKSTPTTGMISTPVGIAYMKSSTSTEFVVMFQNNIINSDTHYSILIATREVCNMSVIAPAISMSTNKSLSIGSNYIVFDTNSKLAPTSGNIENKGIHLKSEKPISVFGLNQRTSNAEAFLVLPLEHLGNFYKIVSIQPSYFTSVFMIAAVYNRTTVTITLNATSDVVVNGKNYHNGGAIRINLKNLDTIEITSLSDLTGSKVTSDKPVAVTSGNWCTYVFEKTHGLCAPIVEYLLPVNMWGLKFVVPVLRPATGFYLKIVASSDYTRVVVSDGSSNVTYLTNSNQNLEISRDSLPLYIESNKPIYVGLITKTTTDMSAVFVNIPAISQFTNAYQITTPDRYSPTRTITVIIESRKKDGLLFDGSKVNFQTTQGINTSVTEMAVVTFTLNNNYTEVTHEEKGVKFGVLVHGVFHYHAYRPAYGYPGGLALRNHHSHHR